MVELTLVLGSTSDWKSDEIGIAGQLEDITRQHDDLIVRVEFASAHNTPEKVPKVLGSSRVRPSGAGMSAALPGVIEACYTRDPKRPKDDHKAYEDFSKLTVGVPFSDPTFQGLTAFLSIAEMPPNNPVLCAGIDNVAAGIKMAYHLEKGVRGVVLANLHSVKEENYAKMRKKLDGALGRDAEGKPMFLDIGEVKYGWRTDRVPEEAEGCLVIGVCNMASPTGFGGFMELDRVLAETGGIHLFVNDGSMKGYIAEHPLEYARQFSGLKATGTMAIGSVGYTNAAQFAARAMGLEQGLKNVLDAKIKKAKDLTDPEEAPAYIVQNGEVKKAD